MIASEMGPLRVLIVKELCLARGLALGKERNEDTCSRCRNDKQEAVVVPVAVYVGVS